MPGRKRILIVDTDAERLLALEHMLEDAGFDTTTTWDSKAAIDLVSGDGFNLVLIGEHPPEINRADILEAVWSKSHAIPCVVMRCSKGCFELEDGEESASDKPRRSTLADVIDRISYCLQDARAAGAA